MGIGIGLGLSICSGRAFSPWRVPGYKCRLGLLADRGMTLDGSLVTSCADVLTGSGLIAGNTGVARPSYTVANALYGNRPSIDFTGAVCLVIPTMALAQPCTAIVVGHGSGANATFYDGVDAGHRIATYAAFSWTDSLMFAGSVLQGSGAACTAPSIVRSTHNGASSTQHKNGQLVASGDNGAGDSIGITIGSALDGTSNPLEGSMAAFFVYEGAIDAIVGARLDRWLCSWSAIALA